LRNNEGKYLCARFLKKEMVMTNWLFIGGAMLLVFVVKCIKEVTDVRAMARMLPQERKVVLERRNFYDNHA
jgi:hypothetical protein